MKPRHTPGPWIAGISSSTGHACVYKAKTLEIITKLSDWNMDDARLIAAAPELATKLSEFINVLTKANIDASSTDVDLEATLGEARALLEKINGDAE